MISKHHFVTAEDREVYLVCTRTVRVVPDTAGTCYDKETHGLDEGITPKSTKDKDVELNQGSILQVANAGKN